MITEDELRKLLAEMAEGSEITLKDLMRITDWDPQRLNRFLASYTDRTLKAVRTEPKRDLDDYIYFPNMTTYPVFQIGGEVEEATTAKDEKVTPPAAPEAEAVGGDILIAIQRYARKELVRIIQREVGDRVVAEDTVEWWLTSINHAEEVETPENLTDLYGETMIELKGPPPEEVEEIQWVRLPKRNWYISRKGGFYDWCERTFGWARSEAVDYFYSILRESSDYIRQGQYRLPQEIPIPKKRMVVSKAVKPVAKRYVVVLRWFGPSSKLAPQDPYNQAHEIDAFIRLPQSMPREEVEGYGRQLMEEVLKSISYPTVDDILGWGDGDHPTADFTATTTDNNDDGYWIRYFAGSPAPSPAAPMGTGSGMLDVMWIYRQAGVAQ